MRPIVDFSISRVKNYVTRIPKLEKLVSILTQHNKRRYQAILFSKKDKISPLYKSLALDWLGTIDFNILPNAKLGGSPEILEKLHPVFRDYLSELKRTQVESNESILVVFDLKEHEYHVYEGDSFEKAAVWRLLSKFGTPTEGPFTKRQEYLEALKLNKKAKKGKNKSTLEHDEL